MRVLKLVHGSLELNLLAGSSGFTLPADNWAPKVASPAANVAPETVVEEIPVRVRAASADALSSVMQTLHRLQVLTAAWVDATEPEPTWLHCKLDAETGERRAVVRRIEFRYVTSWFNMQSDPNLLLGQLIVERDPYWESLTQSNLVINSGMGTLGGAFAYAYGANPRPMGDAPARLAELNVMGSAEQAYAWVGFRSAQKHGTLADFLSRWELEAGGLSTDAALATDSTASPGGGGNTKVVVSFATQAGWAMRWYGYLFQYRSTAQIPANYGQYLALLRAKVASGTTAEVSMLYGYQTSTITAGPFVRISATDWTLYPVGLVRIPPSGIALSPGTAAELSWEYLALYARRLAGSGAMDIDCLVLIPVDEYAVMLSISQVAGGTSTLRASLPPLGQYVGQYFGWTGSEFVIMGTPAVAWNGPGLPRGDGYLYVASARPNRVSVLSDTLTVGVSFVNRWLSLRGSTA